MDRTGALAHVEHVRHGPLFDVSRALLDERPVYLKTIGFRDDTVRRTGLASLWTDSAESEIFYGSGMGWEDREDARP